MLQLFSPYPFAALAALFLGPTSAENLRTPLDEQFCQVYYNLDDGNCEAIRLAVRSEIRGSGTPTLELGNPSEKPVLVFFHGWPDTHAMWANQFAAFCGEDGEFACVAPSMMDYNPDVAPADPQNLTWPLQADILHDVMADMGLDNITLVMHDFGSIVGSMYVARHSDIVQRVVAMDIGNAPGYLFAPQEGNLQGMFSFQQAAIAAFRAENDTAMDALMRSMAASGVGPPCFDCAIAPNTEVGIGYKTGWMHLNWVNDDPAWTTFFDTPYNDFEFELTPTWPDDVPQLFLYATEMFHQPSLRTWLDGRGDGSGHRKIGTDHWFMSRVTVSETNEAMAAFFEGRLDAFSTPTPATPNPSSSSGSGSGPGSTSTSTPSPSAQSETSSGANNPFNLMKAVGALLIAKIFF